MLTEPSSKAPVAVVLGTRPEAIKLAEVIRRLGPEALVIHTGQHYDANLGVDVVGAFPQPDFELGVGGVTRGLQIARVVERLDGLFGDLKPRGVIVQGDTNAVVAGALAANANSIPLVHIEAGLRSHDRDMPEEANRVVADHLADLCCAPTTVNADNLRSENIASDRVTITGNTIVEAVRNLLPARGDRLRRVASLGITGDFAVATIHRPENVDERSVLEPILMELRSLELPVVLPLHPRTKARIKEFKLEHLLDGLRAVPPLAYPVFLALSAEATIWISDSGGLQEEASILKKPLVVVRRSTERPEVLGTFADLVQPGPGVGEAARVAARSGEATSSRNDAVSVRKRRRFAAHRRGGLTTMARVSAKDVACPERPLLGISILNYNNPVDTIECLDSLRDAGLMDAAVVVVVDNGSTDDSVELLAARLDTAPVPLVEDEGVFATSSALVAGSVTLVSRAHNGGYGVGNNTALRLLRRSRPQWLWVLNNDTRVPGGSAAPLLAELRASAGQPLILGGRIHTIGTPTTQDIMGGGRIQWTLGRARALRASDVNDPAQLDDLDYISGASMLLTNVVVDRCGYLVDDHFLYWEEAEYADRAKRAGCRLAVAANVVVDHHQGRSTGDRPDGKSRLAWYYSTRSAILFIGRNHVRWLLPASLARLFLGASLLLSIRPWRGGLAVLHGLASGLAAVLLPSRG